MAMAFECDAFPTNKNYYLPGVWIEIDPQSENLSGLRKKPIGPDISGHKI
jgi:hypothetical protein